MNTRTGESALYQYDTDDGTYQYFIAPAEEEEDSSGLPIPGRIGELINSHLMAVMIIIGMIGLILVILMIVLAVKLVHRNQELDDLYDEYDIPLDDEEENRGKQKDKKSKKQKKTSPPVEEKYDDEYDDEYDEEYDDYDDYEDRQATTRVKGKGRKQKDEPGRDDYEIDFIDL